MGDNHDFLPTLADVVNVLKSIDTAEMEDYNYILVNEALSFIQIIMDSEGAQAQETFQMVDISFTNSDGENSPSISGVDTQADYPAYEDIAPVLPENHQQQP